MNNKCGISWCVALPTNTSNYCIVHEKYTSYQPKSMKWRAKRIKSMASFGIPTDARKKREKKWSITTKFRGAMTN